jgi:hypothetical protein
MGIWDEAIKVTARALLDEGGGVGNSIHSWRCEYPGEYGPCDCVDEAAAEVVSRTLPVLLAPLRKLVDEVRGHSEVESEPAEYRTREGSWKDTADTLEHILDRIEGKDA